MRNACSPQLKQTCTMLGVCMAQALRTKLARKPKQQVVGRVLQKAVQKDPKPFTSLCFYPMQLRNIRRNAVPIAWGA